MVRFFSITSISLIFPIHFSNWICYKLDYYVHRSNQAYYGKVFLRKVSAEPTVVKMPTITGEPDKNNNNNNDEEGVENGGQDIGFMEEEDSGSTSEQLSERLITFSTAPKSHWLTLSNIDIIKVFILSVYLPCWISIYLSGNIDVLLSVSITEIRFHSIIET